MKWGVVAAWVVLLGISVGSSEELRVSVGSYNVDNYRLVPTEKRSVRSPEDRLRVAREIKDAALDVLALQEMGSSRALAALQSDLEGLGLAYPYRVLNFVEGQEVHCALLSRFPIVAEEACTRMAFSLYGREFMVLRGVLRVDLAVSANEHLSLINLHLKSKLPAWYADQGDYRLAEARAVRAYIDSVLSDRPSVNLLVVGDLNDDPNSRTLRVLKGTGKGRLTDARPSESREPLQLHSSREAWRDGIAWTHHFAAADQYLRYDYLLMSRSLREHWSPLSAVIRRRSASWSASDHRIIQATFVFPP